MATFKERIKELRLSLNFSIRELSSVTGISKSALSAYECGKREASFESLEALADVFNCDIDYLLGRTDVKNSLPHQLGEYDSLYDAYKDGIDINNLLTEDEQFLLNLFRQIPPERQKVYLALLRGDLNQQ